VRRNQVLQEETHSVKVNCEAAAAHDELIEQRVGDRLKRVLPRDVVIETRRVDRIDPTPNMKRRFVQSRITSAGA
jgi:hypothetical protein